MLNCDEHEKSFITSGPGERQGTYILQQLHQGQGCKFGFLVYWMVM